MSCLGFQEFSFFLDQFGFWSIMLGQKSACCLYIPHIWVSISSLREFGPKRWTKYFFKETEMCGYI